MEEEGLFFYFEHTQNGHKLIIADDSTCAKPIDGLSASLPYAQGESLDEVDVITSFQAMRRLESGSIELKSFDYKVPGARREGWHPTQIDQGDVPSYSVYDHVGEHAYPAGPRA